MYHSATTGNHECRAFDCPPGAQKRFEESWALREKYRPLLMRLECVRFTVAEMCLILFKSPDKDYGFKLRDLYNKVEHVA